MVLSSLLQIREPLLSSLDGVDLDSGLAWLAAPSNDQLSTVRHVNAAGITAHCENIIITSYHIDHAMGSVYILRHTFLGSLTPLGGYVTFLPTPWCFKIEDVIYEQKMIN